MICDECGGPVVEEKAIERAECWFCSDACGDEYFRTPEEIEINRLRSEYQALRAAYEDQERRIIELHAVVRVQREDLAEQLSMRDADAHLLGRLQAVLNEALAALSPFARVDNYYETPGLTKISLVVQAGDVRRARKVLARLTSVPGDKKAETVDEQHAAEM